MWMQQTMQITKQTSKAELTPFRAISLIHCFILICLSLLHLWCPLRHVISSLQRFLK